MMLQAADYLRASAQEENRMTKYPVGGPREPVYALMRELGLSRVWGDKHYRSADGIDVHIYGAGSMARVKIKEREPFECELDNLSERLAELRGGGND
jgi:hypothetical protein